MSTLSEQADSIVDKLIDEAYAWHIVAQVRLLALIVQGLDEIRGLLEAKAAPPAPATVKVIHQGSTFRLVAIEGCAIAETFKLQWPGDSVGVHFTAAAMITGEGQYPEVACLPWPPAPTNFRLTWWGADTLVPTAVGAEIVELFAQHAAKAKGAT